MKKIILTISLLAGFSFCSVAKEAGVFAMADKPVSTSIVEVNEVWGLGQDETPSVIFYPNPVKDYLSVRFPSMGNYTVRIFNIIGEKITEKTINNDNLVKIDLSDLQSGMYFISYEFGGKVVTKTFSKAE